MEQKILISGKNVDAVVAKLAEPEGFAISDAFRTQSTSKELTDPWHLLAEVFDIHFRPSNTAEPFGPMWIMDGKRSIIPSDLTDAQRATLKTILNDISDPEICARIGDILWLTEKDAAAGHIAVQGYLDSGIRLENPAEWSSSMQRYERAVRLARSLGKNNHALAKVLSHIEARVKHYAGSDPLYFTKRALELLHEFRYGNHAELSAYAITAAEKAMSESDTHRARDYYDIAEKLLSSAGEQEKADGIKTVFAETFVTEAKRREQNGDFLGAHHFWEDAIQAYRHVAGGKEKVPELHKCLNLAGEKARAQMKPISIEIDISEQVKEARQAMIGLSLDDAICAFSCIIGLVDPTTLRARVLEQAKDAPLSHTIPMAIMDERGRTVERHGGLYTNDETEREEAIRGVMLREGNMERNFNVQAYLLPALHKLSEEHGIDAGEVERMICDSKFIPANRLSFFVRGITAGFQEDFVLALHLLIPQVEYALRKVLHEQGVIATSIDSEGIEEDWPLGRILAHEKLAQALTPTIVYELKTILNEKGGANLRNLSMHGMMDADAFQSPIGLYCWWLILRLCMMTTSVFDEFLTRKSAEKGTSSEA